MCVIILYLYTCGHHTYSLLEPCEDGVLFPPRTLSKLPFFCPVQRLQEPFIEKPWIVDWRQHEPTIRVNSRCERCAEIFKIRMEPAMEPLSKRVRLLIEFFKHVSQYTEHIQKAFDKVMTEADEDRWEGALMKEYKKEQLKKLEKHLGVWWKRLELIVEVDFKEAWERDEQAIVLFELKKDVELEDDYAERVEEGQVEEVFGGPWVIEAFYQRLKVPVEEFMKDMEWFALRAGLMGIREFVVTDISGKLSECSNGA